MATDIIEQAARFRPPVRRAPPSASFDDFFGRTRGSDLWRKVEIVLPIILAIVLFGPGLAPGALLNLDLVLVPHVELPAALGGLGSASADGLLPIWIPFAVLTRWISGEWLGKLLIVAAFVGAWYGMARLTRRHGEISAQCAGALYALSPLLLTRAGAGHFAVTLPAAMLPWVLPTLVRPGRDLRATFLAAVAMACTGPFGGCVAVLFVVVSVALGQRRRAIGAMAATVVGQAPWLVPFALLDRPIRAAAAQFPTIAGGPGGILRLSAGQGFWSDDLQVGTSGVIGSMVGGVLLVLAIFGRKDLPRLLRRPLTLVGGLGWAIVVLSSFRGFDGLFDELAANRIGSILLDTQRLLLLHLVWLAPSAALGGARLGRWFHDCRIHVRRFSLVLPAALAIVLAAPAVWGLEGNLDADRLSEEWGEIRLALRDQPGTAVALPWSRYVEITQSDGTRHTVANPLPAFLGGDVMSAGAATDDLGVGVDLGKPTSKKARASDPREWSVAPVVRSIENDRPVGAKLADLGVRWIVLLKDGQEAARRTLSADPGLEEVIDGESAVAYRVKDWAGPATRTDGRSIEVSQLIPGVMRVQSSRTLVWNQPATGGWRRGTEIIGTPTGDGRLRFAGGKGVLWQWRAIPCGVSQLVWVGAVLMCFAGPRRRSRPDRRRWGKRRLDTWDSLLKTSHDADRLRDRLAERLERLT